MKIVIREHDSGDYVAYRCEMIHTGPTGRQSWRILEGPIGVLGHKGAIVMLRHAMLECYMHGVPWWRRPLWVHAACVASWVRVRWYVWSVRRMEEKAP